MISPFLCRKKESLNKVGILRDRTMSQVELIWGAFSLMVLGALLTMCMKCRWFGSKQEKTGLSQQSNQIENQQILEVVRSSSISGLEHMKKSRRIPGPSKRKTNVSIPKHPSISRHAGSCAEPRYKHSRKETATDPETAYVEPIRADYSNCGEFLRPPNDEDSHAYENVIGPSQSSGYVMAEADVYENSRAIQLWKRSCVSESSTDDEPDYINAEVALQA
ncbi:linker for activation of T-cells family member 2 [Tiliqua scincoides]|uniref:linker for activation of T-cells family member 2 n=1 Tax=Tiliqua scincoides TaxID=71010 RepID=UPI003461BBC3